MAKENKTPISLASSAIVEAQYSHNKWTMKVPSVHGIRDILQPEYYAHFAGKLRVNDEILAVKEDNSFRWELLVTAQSRTHAQVIVLRSYDLTRCRELTEEMRKNAFGQFDVRWTGQTTKYAVVRTSNDARVASGFADKDEAANYLKNHVAELIAAADAFVVDETEKALAEDAAAKEAKGRGKDK